MLIKQRHRVAARQHANDSNQHQNNSPVINAGTADNNSSNALVPLTANRRSRHVRID